MWRNFCLDNYCLADSPLEAATNLRIFTSNSSLIVSASGLVFTIVFSYSIPNTVVALPFFSHRHYQHRIFLRAFKCWGLKIFFTKSKFFRRALSVSWDFSRGEDTKIQLSLRSSWIFLVCRFCFSWSRESSFKLKETKTKFRKRNTKEHEGKSWYAKQFVKKLGTRNIEINLVCSSLTRVVLNNFPVDQRTLNGESLRWNWKWYCWWVNRTILKNSRQRHEGKPDLTADFSGSC